MLSMCPRLSHGSPTELVGFGPSRKRVDMRWGMVHSVAGELELRPGH